MAPVAPGFIMAVWTCPTHTVLASQFTPADPRYRQHSLGTLTLPIANTIRIICKWWYIIIDALPIIGEYIYMYNKSLKMEEEMDIPADITLITRRLSYCCVFFLHERVIYIARGVGLLPTSTSRHATADTGLTNPILNIPGERVMAAAWLL